MLDKIRGLKYISWYESSGYGNAARSYLNAIRRAGIPLTWSPMVPGMALGLGYEPFKGRAIGDPELDRFCNRQIDYDAVIIHTVPEYYPFWTKQESNNKRIFGYTVWETDKLPRHWPSLLNLVDHLLVPCHWNRKVFRQGGVKTPIDVVPHIFEEKEPIKDGFPWGIRASDYVFYTIGVWTDRKAIWNVVRCYLDTFTIHDPTLLVIKTRGRDFTRRFLRKWLGSTKYAVSKIVRHYRSPARIMLIDDEISDRDILRLHSRGDCYISLCRSEGWGLGAFDAAGYGKPVIMTGFGGQLDYLPPDLAFLVDYSLVPVMCPVGRRSYSKDQHWAIPDLEHASFLMRQVFENREEAEAKGALLRKHIRQHFSRESVRDRLLKAITKEVR